MLSKRSLLFVSLIGVAFFFLLAFSKEIGFCPSYSYSYCLDILNQSAEILIPILAALLFCLITYWMRDEVYRTWFRFARWAIPLSMFLILITPEYGGGLFNPIQKGSVAFVLTALFFIISLAVILIKHFRSGH